MVAARQVVTSCTWPFESCYPAGYPPPRAHAPSRSRCASVRASSRPPIRVRFWRAAAFSGNGPRTSVLYRRFLVFGLRALALTELRRMQQRVSRSTNRETEFNCCHFKKLSCEYCAVTKLYVGNLPFTATEEGVRALFSAHGTVEKVSLITDRDTGRPRGFGFVEMSNADASRAMQALNGKEFEGRALKVNEAQDRDRSGGGSRGGPRRY